MHQQSIYDRGEPPISYRWIGRIWEHNPLKFKIARKLPIILKEFLKYTPIQ